MNGTIIPFVASVQPLPNQLPAAKAQDASKAPAAGPFSTVLASAVTAKTPSPQAKAAKPAAKDSAPDSGTDSVAANVTQSALAAMPLQAAPSPAEIITQNASGTVPDLSVTTISTAGALNPVNPPDLTGLHQTQLPLSLAIPAEATGTSAAAIINTQSQILAAAHTTANSQQAPAPVVAADPSSAAATPNLTALIQPPLTAPAQQSGGGPATATPTAIVTQPQTQTQTQTPVLNDTAAVVQTPLQQPLQDVSTTSGQTPAAPLPSPLPGSQTQQAGAIKADADSTRKQASVPAVAPVSADPAQPAASTQDAAWNSNQAVVSTAQNSGTDNKNDGLASGDLTDTKLSVDKLDTTTDTTAQFASILDQHVVQNSQAAAPATNTPQVSRQDPYNIAGQIVEQARLITRPQNSEMIIKLKPEHLGELTMRIVVENGAVSASFHSSNPDVRAALEASQVQFKQDMINQGIKVNDVGIYASLDQFSANQEHSYPQQQPVVKIDPKIRDGQEAIVAVEATASTSGATTASGVDYRV